MKKICFFVKKNNKFDQKYTLFINQIYFFEHKMKLKLIKILKYSK